MGLFSNDAETLAQSIHIHRVAGWSLLLLGSSYVLFAPLRAAGKVFAPLLVSVTALWLVRMPLIAATLPVAGPEAIWRGIAIAAALSIPLTLICFPLFRWTERANLIATSNLIDKETSDD